jgi:hypothetical protein
MCLAVSKLCPEGGQLLERSDGRKKLGINGGGWWMERLLEKSVYYFLNVAKAKIRPNFVAAFFKKESQVHKTKNF